MPSLALEIDHVAKRFGDVQALTDVSLQVAAGTVHCVLGENGAGKSTLCNLVFGAVAPDAGEMRLYGEVYRPRSPADALAAGVAMVHQHFALVSTLTVEENLLLHGQGWSLRRAALRRRLDEIRDEHGLEVDPGARVDDLTVGARQEVEIVRALLSRPRLLLLDEPTGVLGAEEVQALMGTCRALASSGQAVVLVSHKLGDIAQSGDTATVLRGGHTVGQVGLRDHDPAELVSLIVGRGAETFDSVVAANLGIGDVATTATTPSPARHVGRVVLNVRDLRRPQGRAAAALDGMNLTVRAGEIVGVAGVEGNGQSELARVISGALQPTSGDVILDGISLLRQDQGSRTRSGLGVVCEDRHLEGCIPELSVAENVLLHRLGDFTRLGLLNRRAMARHTTDLLQEYDVRYAGPDAPMSSLSGGNQQKAVLARELSLDPLLCLVATQPTRGLDVGAVDAVLGRLRVAAANGTGVLLISSELDELLAVCDRILVAFRGELLGEVRPAAPGARHQLGALMTGTAA